MIKQFLQILMLMTLALTSLNAYVYINDDYAYQLEPPIGWHEPISLADNHIAFQDAERKLTMGVAVLQDVSLNEETITQNLLSLLPVSAYEYEVFDYYGQMALVGYMNFSHQNQHFAGPFVVLYDQEQSYWLYGFYLDELEEQYFIFAQSMIDSFALKALGSYTQGLLSVYNDYLWQAQSTTSQLNLEILGTLYQVEYSPQDELLSQTFIGREAQILLSYPAQSQQALAAWQRYYRMVFKDTYPRLKPAGELWKSLLEHTQKEEAAAILLEFSQNFSYMRSPYLLSDLISPLSGLLHRVGDCDSMGLLYAILLAYVDISSVLLISQQQAHAIIGVETWDNSSLKPTVLSKIDGQQAEYIFAELTLPLALGGIPEELYSVKDWLVIPF